jgi:hypothetical protein
MPGIGEEVPQPDTGLVRDRLDGACQPKRSTIQRQIQTNVRRAHA